MSKTAREVIAQAVSIAAGWREDGVDETTLEQMPIDGMADGAIAALDAAGFVIVPKEPTGAMIDAGKQPSSQFIDGSASQGGPRAWYLQTHQISDIYRAMIAAASQENEMLRSTGEPWRPGR